MLFKFVTVATIFASLVSGSTVHLEARQGQLATCRITTTPSNTPNPASGLQEEFILVFNREFAADLPAGSAVVTGSTSFTGPSGGAYVVTKTTGATTLTADQTRAILLAWAGQRFNGAGEAGVTSWLVNSVAC